MKSLRTKAVAIAILGFLATGPAAHAAPLLAHEGHYNMSLDKALAKSGLVNVQGAMVYRFEDSCDGWLSENKTLLTFHHAQGRQVTSSWSFNSWESKDGLRYRFNVRHMQDDQVTDDFEGEATLEKNGGPGKAVFSKPQGLEIKLPAGTLMPARHMALLIDTAQKGEKGLNRIMFDGATTENPYEVNAFVLRALPAAPLLRGKGDKLDAAVSWQMRMAYFALAGQSSTPDFELSLRLREDGVATVINQEFDDFSVRAVLDELKVLPDPGCK